MFLISNLRRMRSAQLRVGADLVADLDRGRGQLGLARGEALLGVRRGGVDHRPGGRARRSASARSGRSRARPRSACRPSCWRSRRRPSRCRCWRDRGRACGRAGRARGWRGPSTVPGRTRARAPSSLDLHARASAGARRQDPVALRLPVEARAARRGSVTGSAGARGRRRAPSRRRPTSCAITTAFGSRR